MPWNTRPAGGSAPKATAPSKKKGGGGFLGAVTHVVSSIPKDVATQAIGAGPGLYHAGKAFAEDINPANIVTSAKKVYTGEKPRQSSFVNQILLPTARATRQDFTPSGLYNHPLYAAQDLAVLASLGTFGAAKTGLLSSERAVLPIRSPRKIAQGEGPVVEKLTSEKPFVRGRQTFGHKQLGKVKYTRRFGSEGTRYGKEISRAARQQGLQELPGYERYRKAWMKLTPKERQALNILPRAIHPADLAKAWEGTKAGEIAANPQVQRLVLNPTPKLKRAFEAQRALSNQGAAIFENLGFATREPASAFREGITRKLGREPRVLPGVTPHYIPDVPMAIRQKDPFAGMGAGRGLPRKPGTAKFNKGVLAEMGKIDVHGDVLGPEFLRRVHLKVHTAVANSLRHAAVKYTPEQLADVLANHGGALPKDWEFLTAPVVTKTGNIRPQRIPPLMRTEGEIAVTPQELAAKGYGPPMPVAQNLRDIIPNPADLHDSSLTAADAFSTRERPVRLGEPGEKAYFDGQFYYVAPKNLIRTAAGEFHRSSSAVRLIVEKPLKVWRAIILGLRVGFFTNNVVGNHILYAIRTAGIGGLRSYLHAVQDTHGAATVRNLLNQPYVPKGISQQLMEEFFPEQGQHGTFGRTQSPATSEIRTRAGEKLRRAGMGIMPATQAVAEVVPRRALVETMIRNSPEFKRVYTNLPKETRTFDQAARQVLEGKGGREYQRFISDQVNASLGDYLNLSPVERNAIRNVLPFYSWYRAIATIMYHLQVDTPGRTLALARLGQIGDEDVRRALGALPAYLRGLIPLGKSGTTTRVLSTGGLNPYATIPQLGTGLTEDVTNLGVNPFAAALIQTLQRRNKIGALPLLEQSGLSMAKNLPISRLISPLPPSTLYPKRNRKSEALGFAGVPLKDLNVAEANLRSTGKKTTRRSKKVTGGWVTRSH